MIINTTTGESCFPLRLPESKMYNKYTSLRTLKPINSITSREKCLKYDFFINFEKFRKNGRFLRNFEKYFGTSKRIFEEYLGKFEVKFKKV